MSATTGAATVATAGPAAVPTGAAALETVVEPFVVPVLTCVVLLTCVVGVTCVVAVTCMVAAAVARTPGTVARPAGVVTAAAGRAAAARAVGRSGAVGPGAAAAARAGEACAEVGSRALAGLGEVVASATGSAPEGVEGACAAGAVAGRAGRVWVLTGGVHGVSPDECVCVCGSPSGLGERRALGWGAGGSSSLPTSPRPGIRILDAARQACAPASMR